MIAFYQDFGDTLWVSTVKSLAELRDIPQSTYHMHCTESWLPGWLKWIDVDEPEPQEIVY